MREIQKYHDGRYRSVDAVYLCGEIGNPDKERPFVPIDKVLEIFDKYDLWDFNHYGNETTYTDVNEEIRADVIALMKGEQE